MATMTNFLFGQHLEESKNKLENLQKELNKCVEEFNYFLNNIDAENYSDFDDFNDKAKTFNEELNKIMSDKQNFIVSFTNIVDNKKEVDIDRLNNFTDYHDFNSKGIYKSANGEYAEAIKYYDEAIKLKPNMADAYYNKAVAKTKLGLLKEAIEEYDKAIELRADYTYAYYNRGLLKSDLGLLEEAIKEILIKLYQ